MRVLRLAYRAWRAAAYARARGAPGLEFDMFGRRLGLRLLAGGHRLGVSYLLNPVSIVRYFEFPCVLSCLLDAPGECLDVGSPRLFSLFVARRFPSASILMVNPDREDIGETEMLLRTVGTGNVRTLSAGLEVVAARGTAYDSVWAISVVEHVSGSCDDREAVRLMFAAVRAGGRLILTVPVAREYWVEYRPRPYYNAEAKAETDGTYFFQRHYDADALRSRIIDAVGRQPAMVRWFGERTPQAFAEYEKRWMRDGLECTVEDPREIVDTYREYGTWEEMPGSGVCCLMFEKSGPTGSGREP